jgi:peptidoglycan/LPS O-acetylase OafA/YrhL
MVGSLLVRLLFLHLAPQAGWEWSYMNLPSHCDGLLCGAIVAIVTRQVSMKSMLRHVKAVFIASLAGLAVIIHHNGYAGYHNNWFVIAGFPLLAVFFTCALLWTIQPGTILSKVGQTRILRFFGKYSYGMYIYHNLFFPLVARLLAVAAPASLAISRRRCVCPHSVSRYHCRLRTQL